MSGSGGFTVSRTHRGDRFYNPPAIRRHQQLLLQQQQLQKQRLPKPVKSEAENRTDSDDATTTLSKQPAVVSFSLPRPSTNVTNLDRLVDSVTPFVPAQCFSEANMKDWRTREPDMHLYYCLGDLWESFREWSVYGVGVPLLLNGKDSIVQYYVPFLSGMQLYVDSLKSPLRLSWRRDWTLFSILKHSSFWFLINVTLLVLRPDKRKSGEESDADSSRETSSVGSSDCELDRRSRSIAGSWSQQNLMKLNSQRINGLSLRDKSPVGSVSDEPAIWSSPGMILFEYFEHEQPYARKPLTDKVSVLASQSPELMTYRSCDLLPASWISVAWYPIYRIPMGSTLRDLDASFLTFHSLSTHSRGNGQQDFHGASGRKKEQSGVGVNVSPKISLPVFGLASYKLTGSILSPSGTYESQQENSLLQAADNWLQRLQIILPDYQFFRSHYSQWR